MSLLAHTFSHIMQKFTFPLLVNEPTRNSKNGVELILAGFFCFSEGFCHVISVVLWQQLVYWYKNTCKSASHLSNIQEMHFMPASVSCANFLDMLSKGKQWTFFPVKIVPSSTWANVSTQAEQKGAAGLDPSWTLHIQPG